MTPLHLSTVARRPAALCAYHHQQAKAGKVKVDYNGSYTYKHIGLSAELMSLDEWG